MPFFLGFVIGAAAALFCREVMDELEKISEHEKESLSKNKPDLRVVPK